MIHNIDYILFVLLLLSLSLLLYYESMITLHAIRAAGAAQANGSDSIIVMN